MYRQYADKRRYFKIGLIFHGNTETIFSSAPLTLSQGITLYPEHLPVYRDEG